MKTIIVYFLLLVYTQSLLAQNAETKNTAATEQELINLSNAKWRWMAERKTDALSELFDEKSVFVHMGGAFSKKQELDVIEKGNIQHKHVDIQETFIQIIDKTGIVLNKIQLIAIVGGNEVTNPFVVTEVYVKKTSGWKLGSMSFTKITVSYNLPQ